VRSPAFAALDNLQLLARTDLFARTLRGPDYLWGWTEEEFAAVSAWPSGQHAASFG
jgi:hypothetical protein